jgi:hypothetical protein
VYKEDGQEYGQVIRMLGNGRLEAQCIDGKKRLCHIRGKMRKKVWVAQVRSSARRCTAADLPATLLGSAATGCMVWWWILHASRHRWVEHSASCTLPSICAG